MSKGRKRKKRRRTLLIIAGLIAAVLLGLLIRYYAVRSKFTHIDLENASPEEQYRLVLALLNYQSVDDHRMDKRNMLTSDMKRQLLPLRVVYILYPVAYAGEKLVSQGKYALPALDRIAKEKLWRGYAAYQYDDPALIDAMVEMYRRKEISSVELIPTLTRYLPIPEKALPRFLPPSLPLLPHDATSKEVDEWIENRISGKSYEEICLSFLDELMEAEPAEGGLGRSTTRLVRWLNRLYDYDLDAWLAKKAPDALAFRNRELKKGYDPAIEFETFAADLYEGMIDEGIKAVFADKKDRKACRKLIEVIYGDYGESPHLCPDRWAFQKGWRKRLRQWYWKNRDNLVYDFEKHRFVVKKESEEAP